MPHDNPRENIGLPAGASFRLLRWTRSVARIEIVHGPGRASPALGSGDHWHYHPETELTLIQRGTGTRFVADQISLFDAGDLVLIGSNVPHYWHLRGTSSGLSLQWDFPPEHAFWGLPELAPHLQRLADASRRGLHIRGPSASLIRTRIEQLPSLTGMARLSAFLQLIETLAQCPQDDLRPIAPRPFSLQGTAQQQAAVRRAVSYIVAHYREPVRLQELLRLTGMSRATFARQFRRHAGKSFSRFLNQVRLQAVCRALRDSSDPVGSIALSHGFNQLSFFNRLFRREFKCCPTTWRTR